MNEDIEANLTCIATGLLFWFLAAILILIVYFGLATFCSSFVWFVFFIVYMAMIIFLLWLGEIFIVDSIKEIIRIRRES